MTVTMTHREGVTTSRSTWIEDWAQYGACSTSDPDALFVRGKAQHDAKAVCKTCPVLAQCLAEALDNRTEFGVWGGMTERQRRALLKQHPDVVSWSDFFAAQRKHRTAG